MKRAPSKPKSQPRRIGYRGGTSFRVAQYRHLVMDRAWIEAVGRDNDADHRRQPDVR